MPAPVFVARNSGSGASRTIPTTVPAGTQSGHFQIVAFTSGAGTESVTTVPSGWQFLARMNKTDVSDTWSVWIYYSTTATGSSSFVKSGARAFQWVRATYSGVTNIRTDVDALVSRASSPYAVVPQTTSANTPSRVLSIFAQENNNSSTITATAPTTGWTTRHLLTTSSGTERQALGLSDFLASGASTPTGSWSSNQTSDDAAVYGLIIEGTPDVKFGNVSAPMSLGANAVGGKRLTRSVSASAMALSASRAGLKRVVSSRTATPMALSATQVGGRLIVRNVSATAMALSASVPLKFGRRVVPVAATALTLSSTKLGMKIGVGAPTASAMALQATRSNTRKIGVGRPNAILILGSTLTGITRVGGDPIPITRIPLPPVSHPLRVIAQRILTRDWIDWDLPVADIEITKSLSGPSLIRGSFRPEFRNIIELGLDAFGTFLHIEIDNEIRASGILMPVSYTDEEMSFEAVGVAGYPHENVYIGDYSKIQVDPLDNVRHIWSHLQSYPEGNIGVLVGSGTTSVRLGEPARKEVDIDPDTNQPRLDDKGQIQYKDIEAKPYELKWWNATNCGQEIDKLAKETPFDYWEDDFWNIDRTDVIHYIRFGWPRIGTKRFDLSFVQGENILDITPAQEGAETFASQVMIVGAGEGQDAIKSLVGERFEKRIRRVIAVTDKTINNTTRATALAREELLARRGRMIEFSSITIDAMHPNAKIGDFQVGDDIYVQVDLPWLGPLGIWHRIISYTYKPERDLCVLELARSDAFRYGSGATS